MLELGCTLDFTGASAESDDQAAEQKAIVDSIIARGIDAMAIACKDAQLMENAISSAVSQGIPVITFDADSVAGSQRHLYLSTVNTHAGEAAGQKMLDLLRHHPAGGGDPVAQTDPPHHDAGNPGLLSDRRRLVPSIPDAQVVTTGSPHYPRRVGDGGIQPADDPGREPG